MSMKFFILIVFVYVVGTLLGSTFEYHNTAEEWALGGGTAGLSKSPITTLTEAVQLQNLTQEQPLLGGLITIPVPNPDLFSAVFEMMTWQFDFLWYDDLGRLFWMIVCLPFIAATVASIAIMFYGMITGNLTWS